MLRELFNNADVFPADKNFLRFAIRSARRNVDERYSASIIENSHFYEMITEYSNVKVTNTGIGLAPKRFLMIEIPRKR